MTTSPSHSGFSVRVANLADYEAIVHLWNECGLRPKITGRDGRAAFERQLAAFPGLYLVAEVNGRMAGVVLGTHDHRKGWINRLAVAPECRRLGIGSALTGACDAALRACGIEIVAALIETGNDGSLRLFRRLGYQTDVDVKYARKLDRPDA